MTILHLCIVVRGADAVLVTLEAAVATVVLALVIRPISFATIAATLSSTLTLITTSPLILLLMLARMQRSIFSVGKIFIE